MVKLVITLTLTALLLPFAALAEEHHGAEYHRHHIAALVSGSHAEGKNGLTLGGDYEFRFSRYVGVMATAEYVGGGFREDLFAFTASFHPWKQLKIQAGPGFERELKHEEAATHSTGEESVPESGRRGLFRFGAGYDFEINKHMTIGPDFAFDILKGEKVFVYGITIGFGFKSK
jgi:hypothetical protein